MRRSGSMSSILAVAADSATSKVLRLAQPSATTVRLVLKSNLDLAPLVPVKRILARWAIVCGTSRTAWSSVWHDNRVTTGPTCPTSAGSVLVFDVLGSLLDEDTGQRTTIQAVLNLPAADEKRFVAGWSARFHDLVTQIQESREGYRPPEDLYEQAAVEIADEQDVALAGQAARRLARFGRALEPFPDVPGALEALARRHPLVALTNAGCAQAFAMSRFAGLRWTTLLSGEVVQAYKPDPRMYQHAASALDLDPQVCVFVAAHRWDLDAAIEHGFRTAYLDRSGDGQHADYEFVAPDLAALVPQLP